MKLGEGGGPRFFLGRERERGREEKRSEKRLNFCTKTRAVVALVLLFSLSSQISLFFFPVHSLSLPSYCLSASAMATTGEQLAAWKQLGGTVRTVKKNKEFIAPGGEVE